MDRSSYTQTSISTHDATSYHTETTKTQTQIRVKSFGKKIRVEFEIYIHKSLFWPFLWRYNSGKLKNKLTWNASLFFWQKLRPIIILLEYMFWFWFGQRVEAKIFELKLFRTATQVAAPFQLRIAIILTKSQSQSTGTLRTGKTNKTVV